MIDYKFAFIFQSLIIKMQIFIIWKVFFVYDSSMLGARLKGFSTTEIMSRVYFPIVCSIYSAYSYITLFDLYDIHWTKSRWPNICDQQSYSAASPPSYAWSPSALKPMLSIWWYSSSIIILHRSNIHGQHPASNCGLKAWCDVGCLLDDHISADMGSRWRWQKVNEGRGKLWEQHLWDI